MTIAVCRWCGAKAWVVCGCSNPVCGAHSEFEIDESNIAITKSARAKCPSCAPRRYARPFTRVRALAQGEWFLEFESVAS